MFLTLLTFKLLLKMRALHSYWKMNLSGIGDAWKAFETERLGVRVLRLPLAGRHAINKQAKVEQLMPVWADLCTPDTGEYR